jgi:hypothetical protein
MVSQATRTTQETKEAQGCAHHWVIDMANGPTSRGRCRHCNETRSFYNTFEDVMITPGNSWSNDRRSSQERGQNH